ncbi:MULTISPECIES: NTP/NDP exchange transporter [Bartonella]|uniref:ATP:ADP antiporter, AAA family n=1 Tax=Bartonella choladocola TaxID=2750995 RepID=A0A1U9MIM6_9HYPH|nr:MULTISPECIES: MFS transporter [Bartonella]AQT47807.1 ATP:ADP antiporter, AAA family [Bartonella choladocola]MBH9976074.1 MFS transporter [Bartonella choladocola]MBI0015584.1 MFS transporter [Bartonella sp. B10834G3]
MTNKLQHIFERLFALKAHETVAFLGGFFTLFLVFCSYFMLRPVRETFGIAGGVDHLSWLFTATFCAMFLVVPVFGFISQKIKKTNLFIYSTLFCSLIMLGFTLSLYYNSGNVWVGRAFFVWVSVYNLFVISLTWSFLAEVFTKEQAQRLFGPLSAGASLGGITGPLISAFMVEKVGYAGLLLISTALFLSTLFLWLFLVHWRNDFGRGKDMKQDKPGMAASEKEKSETYSGIWIGLKLIVQSPYLSQIAVYAIFTSAGTTFLYYAQARLVQATFTNPAEQTQFFSIMDTVVQTSSILIQMFVTARIAKKFGVTFLLVSLPVMMVILFGLLGIFYCFPILAIAMILRRVGEYALARPAREMLFSAVDENSRFSAKNAIDTFVYRGSDAFWGWVDTLMNKVAYPPVIMLLALVLSCIWAISGKKIGKRYDEL